MSAALEPVVVDAIASPILSGGVVAQLLISRGIRGERAITDCAMEIYDGVADESAHLSPLTHEQLTIQTASYGVVLLLWLEREGGVVRIACLASAEERTRWWAGRREIRSTRWARIDQLWPVEGAAHRRAVQ